MKTTKLFFMAALALMTAACSNSDNDILTPAEQPAKAQGITITAKLAPKSSVSGTRKVTEGTGAQAGTIVAEWAEREGIAILYTVGSEKKRTDATITSVDANGVATITFNVVDGTPDNTECTLVYPKNAAKADKTGVKDYAYWLASQNGELNADLDVRVGAGKIQTTTPSLDVTTQPAAQYSIFKFTAQNISGTGITPSEFKVSDSEGNVITTVSPSSSAFYVALPALSAGTYWFSATDGSKPYIAKGTVGTATTAGNYYQSTVKMATIGDVILSDGKFAAPSSTGTKVAMIAYVSGSHGLAIALADEGSMEWSTAKSTCEGKAAIGGNSWKLPSQDEWKQMFKANGGDNTKYTGLNTAITTAGGTTLPETAYYWSSSEVEGGVNAKTVYLYSGSGSISWNTVSKESSHQVRACLAF